MSWIRELSPEDEDRIINRIADEVIKRELETVTIMFLESVKPVSYIGSQFSLAFLAPFSVFGDLGLDYAKFFEKRENVEKLLKRIEERVKLKDEEKRRSKEQGKLVSERFGFGLEFLPGFLMREDASVERRPGSCVVSIAGDKSVDESVAVSFAAANSSDNDIMTAVSATLDRDDVRRALMLSQDVVLGKLEDKQNFGKIKGHKVSMRRYEWNDSQAQKGIIEAYGIWCDKTKRLFVMALRTKSLLGQKIEKDRIRDLRFMLGSLRCH